jgi:DNA-binding response OmpR family regulator
MPGLSKVIVLDANERARRQLQLGFEREGVPTQTAGLDAPGLPGEDAGLVVVGGVDGQGLEGLRRIRGELSGRGQDTPIVFAGRGVTREAARAAGADEVVLQPAFLRDIVTIGRLLRGRPAHQRSHLIGNLIEITGVYTLVRAFTTLGRSATLTLVRGLRRGEVRFYHGEVTSAQVGMIHGQAALHQLLLWTDARFDFHHEDVVRRQQIPMTHEELFADAERFLEGVRGSSGGLSPSVVLEPNAPRVQSFGRQIPTEVYGVLRMFDGHRMLADVLEDSAYRVFETLRVAQRAVDAGLLRVVDKQPQRATWRAVLSIEQWLIGSEPREPAEPESAAVSPAPAAARTPSHGRDKRSRKRKKKRRAETPVGVVRPPAAAPEIDWGALVPRTVGAEVGPLAGVVPAAHVSGEIVASRPQATRDRLETQPTIVFDETASPTEDAPGATAPIHEAVTARYGETGDPRTASSIPVTSETAALAAAAHATALRVVATTVSLSSEPPHIIDDLLLGDTKPERRGARAPRVTTPGFAVAETSSATAPRRPPPPAAAEPATVDEAIVDEPSDGVIRQHIVTAETAPVKRRRLTSDPPADDRPDDATGEITMPRERPTAEPQVSEPTILVADLAAARSEAVAFSEAEEAFFQAGHDKDARAESFDDLDKDYQPVRFWDRLRGKAPTRPPPQTAQTPAPPDKPDPSAKK